ncbi:MAG: hypothetical protein KAX49_07015 [Halanaerobiales bacterium]|nr:hypothetical protein [Halanaerobiales bacterium]
MHPNVCAFEVHGAIRSKWSKLGWEFQKHVQSIFINILIWMVVICV